MYYYWVVYNFDFLSYGDFNHVIKYCETVYERNGINLVWPIKKKSSGI